MVSSDPPDPGNGRRWAALAVVAIGTLLSAMAGSAINLALPDMGRDLGLSIESTRWVIQVFLLANGVLLPVAGKVGDRLGLGVVYQAGFLLFGIASVACGLAQDFGALVALRVLQAVGGAAVMATGPALLTTTIPSAMRGRALGLVSTATYTGLTIGPPVGGFIVSVLDWRWTFFLNGPAALVVIAMAWRFLPRGRPASRTRSFDWPGALTLVITLPLLLLALSECTRWGLGSWPTLATGTGGLLGLASFVLVERRRSDPLFAFDLFRSRVFTGAVLGGFANYVALFMVIILMPFYAEEALGLSPSATGMLLMAQPLMMAVVASPAGWLSDRIGTSALSAGGLLAVAAGMFGLSTLGAHGTEVSVGAWMALIGLGTGVFISPNSSALMGAAPRGEQGVAGSVLAEARILGMLTGVAVGTVVFHAAGGETGVRWGAEEIGAFQAALRVGAMVAVAGAAAAALRGKRNSNQQPQ
jgi:EmrB/QacA subfamily drug resistance transporter